MALNTVATPLDVARVKRDFPLLNQCENDHPLVYLDSAATAQKPRAVLDAMDVYYETANVPWITYFNGDQAFHGVYWHSNWGNRMSHGCVGMPIPRAQQVYEWSANGTDVWIHD